jgi:hypothetical protein
MAPELVDSNVRELEHQASTRQPANDIGRVGD